MLTRLFWLLACPRLFDAHVRDWTLWDAMGLSKCMHCRRDMPAPELERRERL